MYNINYVINYLLWSNVLMLKPNVGSIVLVGSPLYFFNIVVFPALSKPLMEYEY